MLCYRLTHSCILYMSKHFGMANTKFKIIFPSTHITPKVILFLSLSPKLATHCAYHPPLFNENNILHEEYKLWNPSPCRFFPDLWTSSFQHSKIILSLHSATWTLGQQHDLQEHLPKNDLPDEDCALTSAPWAIRSRTISTCPADAASIKGVQSPLIPRSSTLACIASNTWNEYWGLSHLFKPVWIKCNKW